LSPFWVRSLGEAPRFPSDALDEAYTICSVAGDLKINETVDLPNWPVSMTLPRGIFA
jgi:acetamidase/formamidase